MAKICRKCFDENYPDQKVKRVTLGRQCAWCKAKTESVEILIKLRLKTIYLRRWTNQRR